MAELMTRSQLHTTRSICSWYMSVYNQYPDKDWWQLVSLRGAYWEKTVFNIFISDTTSGVLSACLQMTPSWVVWLVHLKTRKPSKGTWTSSRSGPMGISWGLARPPARCCTWGGTAPVSAKVGHEQIRSSPDKKELEVLVGENLDMTW